MPIYANGRDTSLRNLGRGPGSGDVGSKVIALEGPAIGARKCFFTENGLNVSRLVAALHGSITPSAEWTLRFGPNLDALDTEVMDGGRTTDEGGSDDIMFSNAQIPANSFVCLEATDVSGTVDELAVTIIPELV